MASRQRSDIQWLVENLSPAFTISETADPDTSDCLLSLIVDGERFEAARIQGTRSERHPVNCFSLDGYRSGYLCWKDEATMIFDVELLCIYRLSRDLRRVDILAGKWRPSLRIALLRVIRELSSQNFFGQGGLQFHAASVAIGEGERARGVLVCGARRAGKTSVLLHLLGQGQARYIANDRSLVHRNHDGSVAVSGMPTIVNIRKDAPDHFVHLSLHELHGWYARMTLAEVDASPPVIRNNSDLSLSPAQFCRGLSAGMEAATRLAVLIFPCVNPGVEGIHTERLLPGEVEKRLTFSLMPPVDSPLKWSRQDGSEGARTRESLLTECRDIPGYGVTLGRDAFNQPLCGDALLGLLV